MIDPYILKNNKDVDYSSLFDSCLDICPECTTDIILPEYGPGVITFAEVMMHGSSRTESVTEMLYIYRGNKPNFRKNQSPNTGFEKHVNFDTYGELFSNPKLIDDISEGDLIYFNTDILFSCKVSPENILEYTEYFYSEEPHDKRKCCVFFNSLK